MWKELPLEPSDWTHACVESWRGDLSVLVALGLEFVGFSS